MGIARTKKGVNMENNIELLLTDEEITGLAMITRPDNPNWLRDLVKNTETLVIAKFKAMGYVKWDREKVAEKVYKWRTKHIDNQMWIPWNGLKEESKDYYRKDADQLKEILTGGE